MHHPAELRQMRAIALAVEERSAELFLEELHGASQGWLRDAAPLGGAREVERLTNREKISDLVHLHGRSPPWPDLRLLLRPLKVRKTLARR
jgi:hypothetical protein